MKTKLFTLIILWKNLFSSAHANAFLHNFFDGQNEKIRSSFQIYLQARVGYRFEFLKGRFFLEPALSLNYWRVITNFSDEFQQLENKLARLFPV